MSGAHKYAETMRTCPMPLRECAQCGKRLDALVRMAGEAERLVEALRQAATNLATIRPIDSQFRELAFSDEDVSIGEAAQNWERLLIEQGRAAIEAAE